MLGLLRRLSFGAQAESQPALRLIRKMPSQVPEAWAPGVPRPCRKRFMRRVTSRDSPPSLAARVPGPQRVANGEPRVCQRARAGALGGFRALHGPGKHDGKPRRPGRKEIPEDRGGTVGRWNGGTRWFVAEEDARGSASRVFRRLQNNTKQEGIVAARKPGREATPRLEPRFLVPPVPRSSFLSHSQSPKSSSFPPINVSRSGQHLRCAGRIASHHSAGCSRRTETVGHPSYFVLCMDM
jgi:hypothetical protein